MKTLKTLLLVFAVCSSIVFTLPDNPLNASGKSQPIKVTSIEEFARASMPKNTIPILIAEASIIAKAMLSLQHVRKQLRMEEVHVAFVMNRRLHENDNYITLSHTHFNFYFLPKRPCIEWRLPS